MVVSILVDCDGPSKGMHRIHHRYSGIRRTMASQDSLQLLPKEPAPRVECNCDCCDWDPSQDDSEPSTLWERCACISCGPVLEDGSQRCQVMVSGILMFPALRQSGEKRFPLAFCGNCRDQCLLAWRRQGVIRAREARKRAEGFFSRSRSRSRSGFFANS
jgi:hypothetical protein